MITWIKVPFIITYIGIIFTRLPGINIDRPSAAFFGAVAMVVFGVLIFLGVVIFFFLGKIIGLSIPVIAISGAALILIFGKVRPSKVIKNADWVLLLFFATLFIVVEGAVKAGIMDFLINSSVLTGDMSGILKLHGLSLIMSQIVSNVPYTVMMLPLLKPLSSEIPSLRHLLISVGVLWMWL